jgi:hypothetical protein
MGTWGSFSETKRGRGVTLTTYPYLVPRSPPSATMACSGTALLFMMEFTATTILILFISFNFKHWIAFSCVVHVGGRKCLWTAATSGLLFLSQMIYECGEPRWNYIDRGNPKNSQRNLSQRHSDHHKSYTKWPGREPGLPRWETGD